MNTVGLARAITNTFVIFIFWIVLFLSLFLRQELTVGVILFDLGKSVLVAIFAWFFLIITMDTLVKTMVMSAREAKVDRYDGGLIYHVTEPSPEEKSWQKNYRENNPGEFEEIELKS